MRYIAEKLQITKSTTHNIVQKFRATGVVTHKTRSGRPRKTKPALDKHMVVLSKRNRRLTAPEIRKNLWETGICDVSVSTVKRRLNEVGLRGCVATKKPLLRKGNAKKSLDWATLHRNWSKEDWGNVFWSDESKFELFGTKRRIFVRRKTNEKFSFDCVVPTIKHGGGSVLMWGCFCANGVDNLKRI